MGPTSRAPNSRNLLHNIHPSNLNTTTYSHFIPKQHLQHPHTILYHNRNKQPMNRPPPVASLLGRLPSKNTTLWPSPMTTKSSCRSPNRRLNGLSSHSTKTWRVRHHPNNTNYTNDKDRHIYTIHRNILMRSNLSQPYMSTTDRPKIPNRLLISKPYGPSHRSHPGPNPLRFGRGHSPNNCPWFHIINTILLSQHHL